MVVGKHFCALVNIVVNGEKKLTSVGLNYGTKIALKKSILRRKLLYVENTTCVLSAHLLYWHCLLYMEIAFAFLIIEHFYKSYYKALCFLISVKCTWLHYYT